jgi:hypothetical protein
MSNDRYQEIRDALAMEPTPGPWRADGFEVMAARGQFYGGFILGADDVVVAQMVSAANAPLIAACGPDTTRELLAERDGLAAENARLRVEVERLNRILGRIVEGDGDSTVAIRAGADAFAAAREYLLRDKEEGK